MKTLDLNQFTGFTPGPWDVDCLSEPNKPSIWAANCDFHPITAENFIDGEPFFNNSCRCDDEIMANHELMAAAPNPNRDNL